MMSLGMKAGKNSNTKRSDTAPCCECRLHRCIEGDKMGRNEEEVWLGFARSSGHPEMARLSPMTAKGRLREKLVAGAFFSGKVRRLTYHQHNFM